MLYYEHHSLRTTVIRGLSRVFSTPIRTSFCCAFTVEMMVELFNFLSTAQEGVTLVNKNDTGCQPSRLSEYSLAYWAMKKIAPCLTSSYILASRITHALFPTSFSNPTSSHFCPTYLHLFAFYIRRGYHDALPLHALKVQVTMSHRPKPCSGNDLLLG
mmetsp:Transcript_38388/g.65587  ORF Transcript_38388/g.65587 Transcript_38388/m.65587 type:complete len:158 (+) Transcript_38388:107-580(+)